MNRFWRLLLFLLFFLSGFSGLVYQVVWTRMAFASFGIITPVLSVVLSVFMLGLAVGSWWGGRWIAWLVNRSGLSAAFFYGGAEFLIGIGAFGAPLLFGLSERILLPAGQMNSFVYLLLSALALAVSIFPWCFFMGTTYPFMMAYVRERDANNTESFSYLYLANVLGAMCGVFITAVALVELLGFHRTLWVAAAGNFTIAIVSVLLGSRSRPPVFTQASQKPPPECSKSNEPLSGRRVMGILFSTGFAAMAMEVVWSRAFTPVLKTEVYSFAMIVYTYLAATFLGSLLYRWNLARNRVISLDWVFAVLALGALLPVFVNDARVVVLVSGSYNFYLPSVLKLLGSICPFCAALGYLTPCRIDRYATGNPRRAGRAYAVNVLGCIVGPLVGGYLLLPYVSERDALILLGLPFVIQLLIHPGSRSRILRAGTRGILIGGLAWAVFFTIDFENLCLDQGLHRVIRRDYVASVVSTGEGMHKMLVVNGVGMTFLTPVTKWMAHLPLGLHQGPPRSALVICFGMGTTFRSALTWNIDTTAVELVPSVVDAFGYYHWDADQCMRNPNGHVIIDDGRRYLRRCGRSYDVIVVDPPPPIQAAGSSLLFSTDFYTLAKQHLNRFGIIQMWFPDSNGLDCQAVARAFAQSFSHVRLYSSVEGWGLHLLGSMDPIPRLDGKQVIARMPESAQIDAVEWERSGNAADYFDKVLSSEIPLADRLNPNPSIIVTDDQPFNEYFLLRRMHLIGSESMPNQSR